MFPHACRDDAAVPCMWACGHVGMHEATHDGRDGAEVGCGLWDRVGVGCGIGSGRRLH